VFVLATSPLGVVMMSGASPAAFGEPFTFRGTWTGWVGAGSGWSLGPCIAMPGCRRFLCFVFPGWYVAMRNGFFVEQWRSRKWTGICTTGDQRIAQGEIGDLYIRSASVFVFCVSCGMILLGDG